MINGKSPASRRAGRGLFPPLFIFIAAVVMSLPLLSRDAVAGISFSEGFYDLQIIAPTGKDRMTGQAVTWLDDRGAYGLGINAEHARAGVVGVEIDLYSLLMVIEKPVVKGVSVGAGTGFVRAFGNGAILGLLHITDLYGKVQLMNVGKTTVGTFINCRWLNVVPTGGGIFVLKSGIEVGIN